MLALVAGPTEEPVTVEELRAQCRIDGVDEDALLSSFISAAREWCEAYQNRSFLAQTWRLSLDRFPCWQITIPLPPLQEVSSIVYVNGAGEEVTLDENTYVVDSAATPGRVYPAYNQCWPNTRCQPNAVVIEFVAGYETVPAMTKLAIKLLAAHWYEHREETTEARLQSIPFGVKSLLDPHRLIGVA